jgi:hypothetical protein
MVEQVEDEQDGNRAAGEKAEHEPSEEKGHAVTSTTITSLLVSMARAWSRFAM